MIVSANDHEMSAEITHARFTGEKLRAVKGINLPDSSLSLPSLIEKDIKNLEFIFENADMVGHSFLRTGRDVRDLQAKLAELGGAYLGITLKIETRWLLNNFRTSCFHRCEARRQA